MKHWGNVVQAFSRDLEIINVIPTQQNMLEGYCESQIITHEHHGYHHNHWIITFSIKQLTESKQPSSLSCHQHHYNHQHKLKTAIISIITITKEITFLIQLPSFCFKKHHYLHEIVTTIEMLWAKGIEEDIASIILLTLQHNAAIFLALNLHIKLHLQKQNKHLSFMYHSILSILSIVLPSTGYLL